MFLPNKIKKMNYPKKNVALAHCFKTMCMVLKQCATSSNNPWFYCTWFTKALHMVLKPYARPPKQPMVLLYMV